MGQNPSRNLRHLETGEHFRSTGRQGIHDGGVVIDIRCDNLPRVVDAKVIGNLDLPIDIAVGNGFRTFGEGQIVETVPGWAHDITNVGDDELIVMLWANEIFDRSRPDTIAMRVSA